MALGKLAIPVSLATLVSSQVSQHQLKPLHIEFHHTYMVQALPMFHTDPFDRLLIAQAIAENLVLLTCDGKFGPYGVAIVW